MHSYYWLEKMEHGGESLVLHLAQLVCGEQDEFIGLPLVVKPESPRFSVHFGEVGAFKTVPEMFDEVSEGAEKVRAFLFRESSSAYMKEMGERLELARDIEPGSLRHHIVYAENAVTHVLSAHAPVVSERPR